MCLLPGAEKIAGAQSQTRWGKDPESCRACRRVLSTHSSPPLTMIHARAAWVWRERKTTILSPTAALRDRVFRRSRSWTSLSYLGNLHVPILGLSSMASSLDPTSLYGVRGYVALVTGGSSGLGFMICRVSKPNYPTLLMWLHRLLLDLRL